MLYFHYVYYLSLVIFVCIVCVRGQGCVILYSKVKALSELLLLRHTLNEEFIYVPLLNILKLMNKYLFPSGRSVSI